VQFVNQLDLEAVIHRTSHRLEKRKRGGLGIDAGKCAAIKLAGIDRGRKPTDLVEVCGRSETVVGEVTYEQGAWILVAIQNLLRGTRSANARLNAAYPTLGEGRSYGLLCRRFVELANIASVVRVNLKEIVRLHVADEIGA